MLIVRSWRAPSGAVVEKWAASYADDSGIYVSQPNAEFIAHARSDVDALVAEVERLRGQLVELNRAAGALLHADFERDDVARARLDLDARNTLIRLHDGLLLTIRSWTENPEA